MNLRRSSLSNRIERVEREMLALKSLVEDFSYDQGQIHLSQRLIVDAIVRLNDVLRKQNAEIETLKNRIAGTRDDPRTT